MPDGSNGLNGDIFNNKIYYLQQIREGDYQALGAQKASFQLKYAEVEGVLHRFTAKKGVITYIGDIDVNVVKGGCIIPAKLTSKIEEARKYISTYENLALPIVTVDSKSDDKLTVICKNL